METQWIYLLIGFMAAAVVMLIIYMVSRARMMRRFTEAQTRLTELDTRLENAGVQLEQAQEHLQQERQTVSELTDERNRLNAERVGLHKELDMLRQQQQEERTERTRHLEQQLQTVKEQLTSMTHDVLKLRAEEFAKTNTREMDAILNPLKETIGQMKASMDATRDQGNRNTVLIEEQIKQMLLSTQNIGLKADNLASALRNDSKVQGDWGERILGDLLESQGLKQGIHYDVQQTLRDAHGNVVLNEEGAKMRPDVILHYPDNKDVVIDSKVSMSAFVDYRNADDEDQRHAALLRHIDSVRKHVTELSRKDYSKYIQTGHESLDYVIMFVPNESALQLALLNDTSLWYDAFSKGVFITGEQNLVAALRLIQLAWTQDLQKKNHLKVYSLADTVVKRVGEFCERYEDLGKGIDRLRNAYDEGHRKLYSGNQSLVGPANKLVELGAKEDAKHPLPKLTDEEPDNLSD